MAVTVAVTAADTMGQMLTALLSLLVSATPQVAAERYDFTLDNGMRVILAPSPMSGPAPPTTSGGAPVAITMLFAIGELHDPPGQSGVGHAVEHLYATSAAGLVPARAYGDIQRRYPQGSNFQTLSDHTIAAVVIGSDRLDRELIGAAAQLGELRIEQSDLDREWPRIERELANMYGAMPGLAALNLARAPISPLPESARAGGVWDQIKDQPLDEMQKRIRSLYAPRNALLVISGGFDPERVEPRVRELFGSIAAGSEVPPASARPAPNASSEPQRLTVPCAPGAPAESHVAVAFRPPLPSSPEYAAYALLVMRMQVVAQRAGWFESPFPPSFVSLFLDPNAPVVLRRPGGTDPDAALGALMAWIRASAEVDDAELTAMKAGVADSGGWMIGAAPIPPLLFTTNPYGAGYAIGRQAQLAIDPAKMSAAIAAVDLETLKDTARRLFAAERLSSVIVICQP